MSDNTKPTVLLEHYLKQLRLPTMQKAHASMAATCAQQGSDYQTYLLRLAERELNDREKRAAERRIKQAKFPVIKTLDTFDFTAQPSLNEKLIRELATGEYIDRKENILLVGNSGTGKTHIGCGLAFTACTQGKKVRFYTVSDLVTQLTEAREERQLQRMLKQLERHDLLVLDELGYVPFSQTGAELLFEVISRAYERVSLIVTTNLPFEQWTEVCGSERLTGAILDRLTHHVHILEANGESYRLKDSKRRGKRDPAAKRRSNSSNHTNTQAQPGHGTRQATPSEDQAQPNAEANANANADAEAEAEAGIRARAEPEAESPTHPDRDSEVDDNA